MRIYCLRYIGSVTYVVSFTAKIVIPSFKRLLKKCNSKNCASADKAGTYSASHTWKSTPNSKSHYCLPHQLQHHVVQLNTGHPLDVCDWHPLDSISFEVSQPQEEHCHPVDLESKPARVCYSFKLKMFQHFVNITNITFER